MRSGLDPTTIHELTLIAEQVKRERPSPAVASKAAIVQPATATPVPVVVASPEAVPASVEDGKREGDDLTDASADAAFGAMDKQ
jgi:hypothetical protein